MTFADEIDRPRSFRHTLVRMTPGRYVGAELVAEGGGIYGMTFPYPIARIERNGTALTEDATAPTVNDHWCHDEATGALDIKLASAPSATTNVVVVFYYLFYSSQPVSTYETPTDSASTVRPWLPYLEGDPAFQQALSDVFYGIMSVQQTNLKLRNPDNHFQAYLSANDSFFNKACDCWIVVNDTVQKVFTGAVASLQIDDTGVSLTLHDVFERLLQQAYMGDDFSDAHLLTSEYAAMDPSFNFTPRRYLIGRSRHNHVATYTYEIDGGFALDPESTDVAVYASTVATIGGTANRGPYALPIRTDSAGLKTLSFGTFWNATLQRTDSGSDRTRYHYTGDYKPFLKFLYSSGNEYSHNLEVGDSFSWTHASVKAGATQYAVVIDVDFGIVTCLVMSLTGSVTGAAVNVTAGTFNTNSAPAIAIWRPGGITFATEAPQLYLLAYGRDFTLSVSTLTSGNKKYEITLVNNFETALDHDSVTNHANLGNPDPKTYKILFRATSSQASSATRHDQALKRLLEAAGLTCDAATFTAAGAALPATVSLTIPDGTSDTVEPYVVYAQAILKSVLGFVSLNATDGEVEYALVEAPSSTDDTDANLIGAGSFSTSIDYRDIATELAFLNRNVPANNADLWHYGNGGTVRSRKAQYLHGTARRVEYDVVTDGADDDLDGMETRREEILALLSTRRAVYGFRLATKLLDAAVGDDVQLTRADLLGAGAADDVKVITLNKSADGVYVEATDLEGI